MDERSRAICTRTLGSRADRTRTGRDGYGDAMDEADMREARAEFDNIMD